MMMVTDVIKVLKYIRLHHVLILPIKPGSPIWHKFVKAFNRKMKNFHKLYHVVFGNQSRNCINIISIEIKRELLQVRQRSVCNIKNCNVIEMTICVDTINGVIRIKNSTCLWNDNILLIRENQKSHRMITTVLAVNTLSVRRKLLSILGP